MPRIQRDPCQLLACLLLMLCAGQTVAIEEPAYEVVGTADEYELRRYQPYIVAETEVEGDLKSSGSAAFRILADYIFGNNTASRKMAMTAPVEAAPADGTKMAMTVPVESRPADADRYVYAFVMEDRYTLDTLPKPNNPDVRIRQIDGEARAVRRYSGRWTQANYDRHVRELLDALARDGIEVTGEPVLARFNGPLTPWFMRRNEVQVSIRLPGGTREP